MHRARLRPKTARRSCENKAFARDAETSFTNITWPCENEAFVRDFLEVVETTLLCKASSQSSTWRCQKSRNEGLYFRLLSSTLLLSTRLCSTLLSSLSLCLSPLLSRVWLSISCPIHYMPVYHVYIYIRMYVCVSVCVCCASNEVWKASSRETHIWPCNHSWWTQPPKQPPAGNWLGNHQGSHIHCRIFLHTSRAFWTAMIFGCHFKLFIYYLVFWRLFSRFEIHHWSIRVNGFHNLSSS